MLTFKVYLGGPIAGCTDSEANDWRDDLTERYAAANIEFVNPMARDYRGEEGDHTNEIVDLDKRDIDRICDALLFNLPCRSRPYFGSSMEIKHGFDNGLPIVVAIPEGLPVSPWVRRHATKIVRGTPRDAMIWIVKTFASEIGA